MELESRLQAVSEEVARREEEYRKRTAQATFLEEEIRDIKANLLEKYEISTVEAARELLARLTAEVEEELTRLEEKVK